MKDPRAKKLKDWRRRGSTGSKKSRSAGRRDMPRISQVEFDEAVVASEEHTRVQCISGDHTFTVEFGSNLEVLMIERSRNSTGNVLIVSAQDCPECVAEFEQIWSERDIRVHPQNQNGAIGRI